VSASALIVSVGHDAQVARYDRPSFQLVPFPRGLRAVRPYRQSLREAKEPGSAAARGFD